jgi:uncharacterized membrane protein
MKEIAKEGFVLFLPIGIAFFIFKFIFDVLDGIPQPVIEAIFGREITGLGFGIVIALSLLLGLLTATVIGRSAYGKAEMCLARLPVFGGVCGVAKQVVASASGGEVGAFTRVVAVEYPSRDIYSLGFLTKTLEDGRSMVYVPSTLMPNTGVLIVVWPDKVVELDISMGDGMRIITSAGVVSPDLPVFGVQG